jgi:prespore-specific regulator
MNKYFSTGNNCDNEVNVQMNMRQDAWQEQDDLTLAETVLKHIREGSTQLAAFEETAELLSRTAAACGFRWNSEVRKRYENEIKEAKIQRQSLRNVRRNNSAMAEVSSTKISLKATDSTKIDYTDHIISAARNAKLQQVNMAKQIKALSEELQEARERISALENELYNQNPERAATEDYQALIQILDRARKIGALDKISG